jgi:hypothetical protein
MEQDGIRFALHRGLGSTPPTITIDHGNEGFTASLEP